MGLYFTKYFFMKKHFLLLRWLYMQAMPALKPKLTSPTALAVAQSM
jgi:hypothetical protein